jgi:hypothetical protein
MVSSSVDSTSTSPTAEWCTTGMILFATAIIWQIRNPQACDREDHRLEQCFASQTETASYYETSLMIFFFVLF